MKHEIEVIDAEEEKIKEQSTPLLNPETVLYFAVITSDTHMNECAASIRELSSAIKFIGSVYDFACSEFNRLHRTFTGLRKTSKAPLEDAKRVRTAACGKYVDARDAAARLEREKIEDAARKEAEAARAEQVVALREADKPEAAQAVAEAPVAVYLPPPPPVAKPVGVVLTKHWKARVINADLVPDLYKIPDLVTIGKFAREHKEFAVMPGVKFYSE